MAMVAVVGWIDDHGSLHPVARLLVHLGAGVLIAWSIGQGVDAVPGWEILGWVSVLWWTFWTVSMINVVNFMDGIDAISAVEAASIGGGVALIAGLVPASGLDPVLGLTLAAAAIGFLGWNWPPAKIFLGDVGSVPLGFLLGWLLLKLAAGGNCAPALILPLYYLADATITLARRAARREPVWRAHREHYYQRAVQGGRGHARVSTAIGVANLALVALAVLSLAQPWIALALAVLFVLSAFPSLYHGIGRDVLANSDMDLLSVYEALLINAGQPVVPIALSGYSHFLSLAAWFHLFDWLGLIPVHDINGLLAASDFDRTYAALIRAGR
mgnify:CR=1 FL=1